MITKIIAALKGNLTVVLIAVGVAGVAAAAGTAGWIYANRPALQDVAATPQAEQDEAAPGQRQASLPDKGEMVVKPTAPGSPEAEMAPDGKRPAFDVVRVEPDGAAVIAGRAEPGSKVVLFANSKPVGETKADGTGSWVLILEKPLPAGANDLWLSAEKPGSPKMRSVQSVAVVIDKAKKDEEPLVVVQDEAGSRVLQKPEGVVVEIQPPAAGKPGEPRDVAALTLKDQPQTQISGGRAPVSIDAADYDVDGWLHMSGNATPSSTVRLYYDNEYIGDTQADAAGNWSLSFKRGLDGATHTVRADQVAPDSGKILARSEVSFIAELPEGERRRLAALENAPPPPGTEATGAAEPTRSMSAPDAAETPPPASETSTEMVAMSEPTPPAPPGQEAATAPEGADVAAAQPTAEPPAPTVAVAANLPRPPNKITVVRGDNLWRISRTFYGRGIRYTTIFQANRDQIRNPHWIYPGQVFLIPRLKQGEKAVD